MVDSFPSIFSSSTDDSIDKNYIDAETLLSTNTSVIQHITDLKGLVARAVKVHERETLLNGLDEIVDAFQEGWNSDSDWDDDL